MSSKSRPYPSARIMICQTLARGDTLAAPSRGCVLKLKAKRSNNASNMYFIIDLYVIQVDSLYLVNDGWSIREMMRCLNL